jgi:hypothetical protein
MIFLEDSLGTSRGGRSCGPWGSSSTQEAWLSWSRSAQAVTIAALGFDRRAGHGEIIGAGLCNLMGAAPCLCRGLR